MEMYSVYLLGRNAVCPVCSGLLIQMGEAGYYRCNDCESRFKIAEMGLSDKDIEVKRIGGGAANG